MRLKRTDLHEYQNYSVQFIKDHPTAAIVLDCGLGKTVTSPPNMHSAYYAHNILGANILKLQV